MTDRTHYEVLGVPENATQDQIRSAYRKLVLQYHPDRSGTKSTTDIFVEIVEAYSVLSNPTRRANYDAILRVRREQRESARRSSAQPQPPRWEPQPPSSAPPPSSPAAERRWAVQLNEAMAAFSRGRLDRAESIVRQVLNADYRIALAHAILGDVLRERGDLEGALTHYAYAIQFDPQNQTYQRRYFGIQHRGTRAERAPRSAQRTILPMIVATAVTCFCLGYIVFAKEPAAGLPAFVGTWTVGLLVMLFLNGVALGAALSLTEAVDACDVVMRTSTGKLSRGAALGIIAVVNFWAAAALYLLLSIVQDTFTPTLSRVLTLVGLLTACYAVASAMTETIAWPQTLVWGGNLIYLGVLGGWVVADAFRES
jgi:curved DNA-binding protein CbpA